MVNKIIFFIILLLSFQSFAQKILVKGIARDTTKFRNFVHITVNDTLRKHREMEAKTKNWDNDDYLNLTKNKEYVTHADSLGNYSIVAKLTDTLVFAKYKYYTQKYLVSDIITKNIKVQLVPEPCVPYVACEQEVPTQFYIFIGQKIRMNYESDPYYCNVIPLDGGGFDCVYSVDTEVYGKFINDSIRFKAYDHYGTPSFSKYQDVLLFVGEYCGKLYHSKYQYFDMYKTKEGKWASPGNPYKYDQFIKNKTVQAERMEFDKSAWIDISKMDTNQKKEYLSPFYEIRDGMAIPVMGTYITDLIKVKKERSLKNVNLQFN